MSERGGRSLGILRAAWGLAELGWPEAVLSLLDAPTDGATRRAARLLGARDLVQGLLAAAGNRRALPERRAVDAAHAVSMLGLAAVDPRRRRAALVSGGTATFWALCGDR